MPAHHTSGADKTWGNGCGKTLTYFKWQCLGKQQTFYNSRCSTKGQRREKMRCSSAICYKHIARKNVYSATFNNITPITKETMQAPNKRVLEFATHLELDFKLHA